MAVVSQRLRAANHAIQQREAAIRGSVAGLLEALPVDAAHRLMLCSVLPGVSPAAIEAVFDQDASEVRANLNRLAASGWETSAVARRALRERLDQVATPEEIDDFRAAAVQALAAAQVWPDALSLAVVGPGVASVLLTPLNTDPPIPDEEAAPWLEYLTDTELADDPKLAALAASIYTSTGRRAQATGILRRAVAAAMDRGDGATIQSLTLTLATLDEGEGDPAGSYARPVFGSWLDRRRVQAVLGTIAAIVCAVGALTVARESPQMAFALLFGSALALWNTTALPDFAVSLGLVGSWMLVGIARADQAVAGFASMDWIFVLAVLGVAVAIARSGLLFRAGILLVRRFPAQMVPQAAALMLTGVLLSPLLPEPRGRAALTSPLALAVAEAFRFRDREPTAALLGLAAWIGSGPLMFLFLNASPVCLLAWGLLPEVERTRFDWLTWFTVSLPLGVVVAAGMLGALFLILRPGHPVLPSRERLSVQLAVLGPVSRRERVLMVVLTAMVFGWFFAPAVGLHVGVVAVFGFFAAAAAGAFDQQAFREMDWSFLIYYGVALSMQSLSAALGVGPELARTLGGTGLATGSEALITPHPWIFIAIVVIAGFFSRLFLEASQAVLLLGLLFFPAGMAVGGSPWLVAIALLATNNPWLTEKQTPAYQLAYLSAEGRLFSIPQGRTAALAYMAVTLAGLLILTPYWRLLGLL